MMVDIFAHCYPLEYYRWMVAHSDPDGYMQKRIRAIPVLVDVEKRLDLMACFPGYAQIPSLVSPSIESLGCPAQTIVAARVANDGMAAMCRAHPRQFPGFVAALPMNAPAASVAEAVRSLTQLGACGVQLYTNVNGAPLDDPALLPLFELMAAMDRPIWLHPARGMEFSDYATEKFSRYELWWVFGWPYETSLAMARIVFAGIFDRWPGLKIITHHAGAMVPFCEERIGAGLDQLGTRTPKCRRGAVATRLKERPLDAFHRFYADTALFGAVAPLEAAAAFFGVDRMLFASDMPFDPEKGPGYIRATLRAVDAMRMAPADREKILWRNAARLLCLNLPSPEGRS